MRSAIRTATSPLGLPCTVRSRCCCVRISTSMASPAMPRISPDWWRHSGALWEWREHTPAGLIKVASVAIMRAPESRRRPMNSSTLTGLAAVLFGAGIIALFAALYRDAAHGGPLLWIGLALLAAAILCWFLAARGERASGLAYSNFLGFFGRMRPKGFKRI